MKTGPPQPPRHRLIVVILLRNVMPVQITCAITMAEGCHGSGLIAIHISVALHIKPVNYQKRENLVTTRICTLRYVSSHSTN